jgi:hypothetical protein
LALLGKSGSCGGAVFFVFAVRAANAVFVAAKFERTAAVLAIIVVLIGSTI